MKLFDICKQSSSAIRPILYRKIEHNLQNELKINAQKMRRNQCNNNNYLRCQR